jgi:putative tricarboxylic transport membrane protein
MSENVGGVQEPRGGGSFVRAPREFYGGLVLMGVAAFALWASRDLGGMRGFAFGPGTAPTLFAWVLMALGAAVAATGLVTSGPAIDRFHLRGPLFVTLSVVLFAWLVRPLGLVIASFLSILAAAGATPEARPLETLIWAAALTAFCSLLFPYALNLPMQMFPNSWDLATILKGLSSIR